MGSEATMTAVIAGLLAGLIGLMAAGAGVYFALLAMGFFEYLGGRKRDPTAVDKHTLKQRLLDLNNTEIPYRVREAEDSDLAAEVKIADARWYGILSKSGLSESYRIIMLLDENRHSVRIFEDVGKMEWSAGAGGLQPIVSYGRTFSRGRILLKKEIGVGYAFKKTWPPEFGKVYDYKFDVDELRGPLKDIVEKSGWEWVPVSGRRHAMYPKTA
jgi:hypothetical protein